MLLLSVGLGGGGQHREGRRTRKGSEEEGGTGDLHGDEEGIVMWEYTKAIRKQRKRCCEAVVLVLVVVVKVVVMVWERGRERGRGRNVHVFIAEGVC